MPRVKYVADDFAETLAQNPGDRVWLITWPDEETPVITDERRQALGSYERVMSLTALRAEAELFVRPTGEN